MRTLREDGGACTGNEKRFARELSFLTAALLLFFGAVVSTAAQTQPGQTSPTVASVVDREISSVEKLITDAAEAMPEDKVQFLSGRPEHRGQ